MTGNCTTGLCDINILKIRYQMCIRDRPTTGLHIADVHKLINVLQKLVDAGNTVVVIEHNLDLIKTADYIIDLGPEGGDKGGYIVATGTPEQVAQVENSYTGQYLKKLLEKDSNSQGTYGGVYYVSKLG